jgi:uncharacterized iron-regulated membrane protein
MNSKLKAQIKRPDKGSKRRRLFYLHSWLGFNMALFMALVIVTGTFAVISDEIDWLIHSELRSSREGKTVSWGTMENAVRAYAPYDTLITLSAGEGDYFNYRARMLDLTQKTYYLYVDQYTGKIAGRTSTLTVQRFLRDLHRYLFMPRIIGLPLVTTMAIVLLISLYTGLKTTRNWRTIATRIRFTKSARVAVGDFHKAVGLWGAWFLLLIVMTSFWYFAELSFAVNRISFEPSRPSISGERVAEYGVAVKLANSDDLVNAALAVMPGFRPTEIQYSVRGGLAATVLGRMDDLIVRQRANRVFLDPLDASVLYAQRSTEIGWIAYVNELADPLHFGSFGKLTTKIIWFVFGLGLLAMSLSGVYLTWKRVKSKTPTIAQFASMPILLVTIFFGVSYVSSYLKPRLPENELSLIVNEPDFMSMELKLTVDTENKPTGAFRLIANSAYRNLRLNLSHVSVSAIEKPSSEVQVRPRTLGTTVVFTGSLNDSDLTHDDLFLVSVTTLSDEKFDYIFDYSDLLETVSLK